MGTNAVKVKVKVNHQVFKSLSWMSYGDEKSSVFHRPNFDKTDDTVYDSTT